MFHLLIFRKAIYSNTVLTKANLPANIPHAEYGRKGGLRMEGHGDIPLPDNKRPAKKGMNKMLVIVVVAIIIIAAIAGAVLLMGGGENKKPVLSATVSDTAISAGESVTFNASASSDPEDGALNFYWDFGDGTVDNATGAVVSHTYAYPGIYMVQLVIEDEEGLKVDNLGSISNYRIDVQNPSAPASPLNTTKPFAFMVASEYMFTSGTSVSFRANETKGYMIAEELYDNGTAVKYDADGNPSFNATGVESNWMLVFDYQYAFNSSGDQDPTLIVTELKWNFGDGSAIVSGSFDDKVVVSHAYTGTNKVYTAYLEVTTAYNATQRYYYSVLVGYSASTTGVKNADKFIMATIGEPDYLDPATDYETAGGEILQNVYETLVFYDNETLNLVPMLATSVPTIANGGISADGLTYTFHLRQGVKFHDGTNMTASDVVYSFGRLLIINDGFGPAWMVGAVLIDDYYTKAETAITWDHVADAIWAVDDYTVQFNLSYAYPAFIYVLAFNACSIVSEDYVEAHGGVVANTHNDWMDSHCCGTGPYKMTEWERNSHILMTRNDNYWREPAALKYVIIKKVQDVGTRILMLKSGDADSIYLPRDHKGDVSTVSTIRIVEGAATMNMDFLGLNQNITNADEIGNIPATFFADKDVRMAFASAFNYDTYITSVFLDAAVQPNGVIPEGLFGYNASIGKYTYNLTAAAEYLKAAENPASPGDSYADTGFELTLFFNAGNLPRETACQLMKAGLESLKTQGLINGTIDIEVQALDWPVYLLKVRNKELPAFFLGWAPDYADPDNYMTPFLHSSGTYAVRCSINNATITDWIEEAAMELNTTVRAGIYSNISEAVYEECYYIWTAQATSFHVERTWVTGYYFNPMYSGFYYYQFDKA